MVRGSPGVLLFVLGQVTYFKKLPESSLAKEQRWEQSVHWEDWKRRWKESASSVPGRRDCDDYNLAHRAPHFLSPSTYLVIYGEQSGSGGAVMQITNCSMEGKWGWNPLLELNHLPRCPRSSHLGIFF